jgi:O-methyltransferase domain
MPRGGDAYLLKAILHDWEDEDAIRILCSCREAMAADGTLVVVERDLGAPNANPDAKFSDLNMMVGPGGRERTRDEFAALLAAGGFALDRTVPTAIGLYVFEGRPVLGPPFGRSRVPATARGSPWQCVPTRGSGGGAVA